MRVFVSSTIYDLIDIRAELESLLRELGVTPVMSDDKLSDFNLTFDANSIETCLLNVESSDAVIVILDQRYGPRLGKHGFDDVSATHLEYRSARKHGKPIYFYVRDRLEADFNIRHKNKSIDDVKLSWVLPCDVGLLDFLCEHRELRRDSSAHNWFSLFTTSRDLKAAVRRHFEPVIKPRVLLDAIQQNRFPLFTTVVNADQITVGSIPSIKCEICLKNIGLAPAFDFTFHWQIDGKEPEITELVAPGQEIHLEIFNPSYNSKIDVVLKVEYKSAIGISVRERHRVFCVIQGGMAPAMISGGTLIERTYHNTPSPLLVIQEA
jgi:Domain of unknown function (DUF4062)